MVQHVGHKWLHEIDAFQDTLKLLDVSGGWQANYGLDLYEVKLNPFSSKKIAIEGDLWLMNVQLAKTKIRLFSLVIFIQFNRLLPCSSSVLQYTAMSLCPPITPGQCSNV